MELGLRGRAAIVTGASRGIGRAVAQMLASEGCNVVAVSRSPEDDDQTTCAADVTDPDAAARIVAECLGRHGRLDIVVNNAGGAEPVRFEDLTDEHWRGAFELNFFSAVRLAAAAVPVMREARWGRLVHVASVSAKEPDPGFAPYSAAKAALVNWSKSLSQAHGDAGVLSSCVLPGVTLTELVSANARAVAARTGTSADEVMTRQLRRHQVATGRFGEPDEVAAAVVFLASEAAAWITGATLEVDGGTLRSS